MSILLGFLATAAGKWIVGALAVVIAMLGAWMKGRLSGAKAERDKQAADNAKARSVADEIDDAVAGRSPDANRKELGKWAPK